MAVITSPMTIHLRPDRSITQLMLENPCNADPEKVITEDTLTGKCLTYGGLRRDAFHAAYSLRYTHHVRPGGIVTIIGRSCVDYILATHAIWAAGGTVSTINHSSSVHELVKAIQIVGPDLIIFDAVVEQKLREACKLLKENGHKAPSRMMSLVSRTKDFPLFPDDLLTHENRIESEAYTMDGKDAHKACAAIVLSSGTTGSPKAVMLSHHNLVAICEMLRAHNPDNWRGSMREIFFPPLSHIYGLYVCALMGPWLGSYTCLLASFELERFCQLLQEKRATLARLVPTVALALADSSITQRYRYPDLEYFSCSAAPLKPTVAKKLRDKFPGVSLCQTYGCTELSSCISQSGVRDKDAPLVATGTLLPNLKVRFVDEHGRDIPPNRPGEICVSSPTVMMGFKDNEAGTRESMLEPGWYRTGDIGYLDESGYLTIVDRLKDVIKYKGFQVNPTELEELIVQHPGVADAGVVGIWSDAEATEMPTAFVVPLSDVKSLDYNRIEKEIKKAVALKVAGYKQLRGGVKFIDKLPRNPTGKLLRRELREKGAAVRAKL